MQRKNWITFLGIMAMIALTAAPHLAEARAGGGRSSMGSRGSRTYSTPSSARPIERSQTPQQPSNAGAQPGFAQPANNNQPGFAQPGVGSPFWRGVGGGILGAGIGSLLFGHSGYADGMGGGAPGGVGGSGIGLVPLLLIGGVLYFLYRRMRNNGGMGSTFGGQGLSSIMPASNNFTPSGPAQDYITAPQAPDNAQMIAITEPDQKDFESTLINIQKFWSAGDLSRLRAFVTPEMWQYFSEELSANASKGTANIVENVKLERAELLEAWHEYNLDYATMRLQWSALDYMARLDRQPHDADYVASGSNTVPDEAEEIWTFARATGGKWLLSAIQQTN